MIAITFALPEESRDLLHLLRHPGEADSPGLPTLLGNLGPHEILVVHTGMGLVRTRERLARLFEEYPIDRIVSAGYAGGLDPRLPTGALLLAENYSSPELLVTACSALGEQGWIGTLATSETVLETREAKAVFAGQSGAMAVDMETAAIADACRERGVPLLSIRVISDTAREELAVPFSVCFDARNQRPRPMALLGFLARHPSRLRGFIQFAMAIARARAALTRAILVLLERFEKVPADAPYR